MSWIWPKTRNLLERTSFLSFRLVTMTIVAVFCSQIILQKSFTVSSFGPEGKVKQKILFGINLSQFGAKTQRVRSHVMDDPTHFLPIGHRRCCGLWACLIQGIILSHSIWNFWTCFMVRNPIFSSRWGNQTNTAWSCPRSPREIVAVPESAQVLPWDFGF